MRSGGIPAWLLYTVTVLAAIVRSEKGSRSINIQ